MAPPLGAALPLRAAVASRAALANLPPVRDPARLYEDLALFFGFDSSRFGGGTGLFAPDRRVLLRLYRPFPVTLQRLGEFLLATLLKPLNPHTFIRTAAGGLGGAPKPLRVFASLG